MGSMRELQHKNKAEENRSRSNDRSDENHAAPTVEP